MDGTQSARMAGTQTAAHALRGARSGWCGAAPRELRAEQWVARPPVDVFPFFADPANLERLTPGFLHFRVLSATTERIEGGTIIEYALRLHGLPLRWRSRIEGWLPQRRFVDVQLRGPYRSWRHTHEFVPVDGGTLIRDRIRYRLPFGAAGDLCAGTMVRRDLDAIFAFRQGRIREMFR